MSTHQAPTTTTSPLTWEHFPAGENGFFRSPVVVSGRKEAILVDGGFTFPDGVALAEAIRSRGKVLSTIYISQSDPDYYFSLLPITRAFPQARVIAASSTIEAIQRSVEKKLAVWGPQLQANGPQSLDQIVMPTAFDGDALGLEGETLQIIAAEGLANRRYLWCPALGAIFGGVMLFAGVHVWTADTSAAEARAAWLKNLDLMAARKPSVVVAGHMQADAPTDASAIVHTRDYLLAFEQELARAANSAGLMDAMKRRYPEAGMGVALEIGAKVATGEMKWG